MNSDLLDLQTQISYQEDSIQQLNDVITQQQADIILLRREMNMLKTRFIELMGTLQDSQGDEAPPPHY